MEPEIALFTHISSFIFKNKLIIKINFKIQLKLKDNKQLENLNSLILT
jgi:hypothetical protein